MADNTFEQPIVVPFTPAPDIIGVPLDDQKAAPARLSLAVAVDKNADFEADLAKVAKATGVPMETVRAFPNEMKRQQRLGAIDFDGMAAKYPATTQFYADQTNADVGHDDMGVLQRVESGFNSFKRGWEKGSIQDELGELNYKAMTGTITPVEQARREKLKGDMGYVERQQKTTEGSAIDYFTNQTAYTARQMVSSTREGLEGAAVGASAGAVAAAIAGQLGPQVALPEEIVTVPGAAALGGRAGFISSAVLYNYKMESGFAFDEFSDLRDESNQPMPRDVVQGAAVAVGLVNAGLETVGQVAMLKLFPGADKLLAAGPKEFVKAMLTRPTVRAALANAGKRWVQAASIEGFTEAIQELGVIFGRELAQGVSGQEFKPDDLGEDAKRVGQAGMDAFVGSMGVGAPGAGYRGYRDVRQAQQMQQNQEFIAALGEDATESKLQTRLPEKYQEFVAKAKENGPIDNIYIPAEQFQTFFQSQGADPAEVASQVGATNYTEALAAGTDVVIPIENYASTLAATPFHQQLAQDIRLRQGDMTAREYAAYQQERQQQEAEIQRQLEEAAGEIQTPALQAIKNDMVGQLVGSGFEASTADAYATMYANTMRVLSERSGQDLQALHERYGLTVSRPLPDVLAKNPQSDISIDPLLDMLRTGTGIPSVEQMRGESLIPFIRKIGGIRPGYGELKDVDVGAKRKEDYVVRETGRALDEIGALAAEAGYFQPDETGTVSETTILNAISEELSGLPTYSIQNENQPAVQLSAALEQLDQYLSSLGIDLKAITDNAAVREAMQQAMGNPQVQEAVQQLFQQMRQAADPTQTEAFRRWFGDSKVVDENGNPLVVYHASNASIEEFKPKGYGTAGDHSYFYFAASQSWSKKFAKEELNLDKPVMHAVYLSIQNPLDLRGQYYKPQEWIDFFDGIGVQVSDTLRQKLNDAPDGRYIAAWQLTRYDTPENGALRESMIAAGYDGMILSDVVRGNMDNTTYVAFEPSQIKSATGNAGTFDPNNPSILFQSEQPGDLLVQHNLTADNLLHAVKMGGIPVPSLAVTKKDAPLTNFGEITLLGSKEMADPKGYAGTKVFGADIYSPRYPSITYEFTPNMRKRAEAQLKAGMEATDSKYIDWSELERDAVRTLESTPAFLWKFLSDRGIEPQIVRGEVKPLPEALEQFGGDTRFTHELASDPAFIEAAWKAHEDMLTKAYDGDRAQAQAEIVQLKENGERRGVNFIVNGYARDIETHRRETREAGRIDKDATRRAMSEQVREAGLYSDLVESAKGFIEDINPNERIFQGYTNAGNRRYIDHTLENVVKILKKELRGGENFNYGVGSLRAKFTPQFKSIDQIRKNKDRLMDAQSFDKVKEEIDNELVALASDFGLSLDQTIGMLEDTPKMGLDKAAKTYDPEIAISDDMRQAAGEFLTRLRNLPTAYFEAKILREVDLAEFSGAVVPEGVDPKVVEALQARGVKDIKFYKKGDDADRAAKIGEFENLFFQGNMADKRGYIQFGADRKFNIGLLEKANLSTFLHETGHFWLEVMGDLATDAQAAEQIKADYTTLLNWFGVESRDQIMTEHHEMFARANEAYLMEGKAPSAELRSIFQRFKSWLTMIYRQLQNLNVELTPEVRGVFDRIYATDQEIEDAKRDVDMAPLFMTAADAGMTEQEFSLYRTEVAKATETAKDALQTKLMREFKREQDAWWKEATAKMREEVAAEVDAMPVYQAFAALTAGEIDGIKVKLNKQALVDKYGEAYVKRLPRKFARIYTTKGGMDADAAATYLGFESGDALVEALVSMRPRNELIAAEADVRMRQTYGDMMTDGTLTDEARIALHNDKREQVLMTELRALRRKQAEVQPFVQFERQKARADRQSARAATITPPVSAFRDAARGLIGQTAVRNIQPYRYLQAERKAARAAFEAMAKGDYQLAADAKQKELLNHYLYLEASKAKEDADATLKYVRKFEAGTTREQMGKAGADYLEQIDALLDRYEFRRIPLKQIDRRKSLALWAAEQEAAGNEPAIDPVLLDEARRVNYREVPIDELRAVRDAIKNIEHLARLKNKLVTKGMQAEFADAVSELVASAENNGTRKAVPLDMSAMTQTERIGETVSKLDAMLLKMEQIVEWLDGGNVNGPWHTYVWNPLAEAQSAENDLNQALTAKLAESLEAMPKEQRESMLDTFDIPGMGKVTRKFIVSMGMNMGNQQNIDKMMRGFGWDMGTIEGALAKLNAADIKFIQDTLDTIGSLWPQIAELEKRMTGLEPPRVETQAFDVRDAQGNVMGTIEGYFPLVYDPRKSEQGAKQETGNLGQLFEEGYVRATTPKGHTKARTEGFAAPLLLDFEQVVTQHLAKVVKDLTHREAIVAANKVLTNPEIRNVLQEVLGTPYEKQMLPWLRSVVNDRNGGSTQGLTDFSRWMMTARANVVAATMGFKATTAIMQITGLSQSLDKVKGKYLTQSLLDFLRHPIAMTREVRELSGEMRHRSNMLDRDIRDQLRNLTGQNSTWAQAQKFAFHGIAIADAMVSIPTWMGAYKQALDGGASEATARLEADAAVRLTQGSGGQKDLSAIQRNNELGKTLTMFYSYFNVLYNRMRDMGRDVQEVRDMPRLLSRVFFTVVIPAVMADMLVGRGPDDDEDKGAWIAKKVLLYPLMSIPVLRDVASSLDSGFDYKFSPIAAGFEKLSKLTTATGKLVTDDIEWPEYALKAADTIGYVFGVAGTAQLTGTGKYLWRVYDGEESPDNLAELLYYATVGKRKEN